MKHISAFLIAVAICSTGLAQNVNNNKLLVDDLKQQLEREQIISRNEKELSERLVHQLMAKEMALRSIEVKDSVFQALSAIQAYKFNLKYEGNNSDIDIYCALMEASRKSNLPVETIISSNYHDSNNQLIASQMAIMADNLCTTLVRNMTLEEWNYFVPFFPYERTCDKD